MPNVESILRDHVTLQVECIDRLYFGGYVRRLQRPGQLAYFLKDHRNNPVPSPALLGQMTGRFVAAIQDFARRNDIPLIKFRPGERKDDVARRRFARFRGREGVVFIGGAQEYDRAFRSKPRRRKDGSLRRFDFCRAAVAVNQYYFYVWDRDWGPGFIRFSSYAPFNVRVCLNGHQWAKPQLRRDGICFRSLDNGFRSCEDPAQLQQICDRLDAEDVDRFFHRWLARLPHPFTKADRAAGYGYSLSIWQMEVSLTQVFDKPLLGRQCFEEILRDNLDLGRADRIQLLFQRRVTRGTPSSLRTRVVHHGVLPKLSVEYKRSRVKQYFKENCALRTETVINDPYEVGVNRGLLDLAYLRRIGRNINHRLLALQRASHNCVLAPRSFESVVLPSEQGGQRAPGLRFGGPRVMAVFAGLCLYLPTANGFTNGMLRERIEALHDAGPRGYTTGRMTYDLRRLRLKGLIGRVPGRNRYLLTPLGRRVALLFAKTYARILRPGLARIDPAVPADATDQLATAWRAVDTAVDRHIEAAHLAP